ncbi:MAG: outer membrane beta-barrel protein [Rhizobiaceae bacterium]
MPVVAADLVIDNNQDTEIASIDPARFDWSGAYVGGFVTSAHGDNLAVGNPGFDGSAPNDRASLDPAGIGGGVLAGYNWQFNNIVFGVEGEYGHLNSSDNVWFPGSDDYFADMKYDHFVTLSGRAGLAIDRLLLFGKAGVAWVHTDYGYGDIDGGPTGSVDPTASVFDDNWRRGPLFGGGVSYALVQNWIVTAEYNRIQLEDVTDRDQDGDSYRISDEIDIFKVSLSAKF